MNHAYIVAYWMGGFHKHMRVYADNKRQARKIFRDIMGPRYPITGIEEVM